MNSGFVKTVLRPRWRALAEAERESWPLFVPVAVGLGVLLWFGLPFNHMRRAALLMSLALALAGFVFRGGGRTFLLVTGLLVATGLLSADWRNVRVATPQLHHWLSAIPMEGTVQDVEVRQGGAYTRIHLLRGKMFDEPRLLLRVNMNGLPPDGLEPGARIRARILLTPHFGPTYPGGYDPARWAWFQGVSATGRILDPPEVIAAPKSTGISRLRTRIGKALSGHLQGDAGAVASALAVGDQGRITSSTRENMQIAGLAHLLAVSGFHISTVAGLVFLIIRRFVALVPPVALRYSTRNIAAIAALGVMFFYLLLSGVHVPALRASIGAGVAMLGLMFGRAPLTLRLVAFAALVILLWQPDSLLSPSFQLSFTAVTALIVLANSAFARRWLRKQEGDGWLVHGLRILATLFLSSLVAELVLTPIALAHFGRTGAYGVVANMVAIPLTSLVIMPLLALWLLLYPLGVQGMVGGALQAAIDALLAIGAGVSAWPGARAEVTAVSGTAFLLLVAGGILLLLMQSRLRFLGLPLLAAALLSAIFQPSQLLLVSPDRRQVAIVGDGHLYLRAGHREGLLVRTWAEATRASPDRRMDDWPGARCTRDTCTAEAGGFSILATAARPGDCSYDIVVTTAAMGPSCSPRLHLLDGGDFLGAATIDRAGRLRSVAARSGDHPWSPRARPGVLQRLVGGPKWVGVMAE